MLYLGRPMDGCSSLGGSDSFVKLWNPEGNCVHEIHRHAGSINAVQWCPDGSVLATAARDRTVRLGGPDLELSRVLQGHQGIVSCLAWSSDGTYLASGSYDHTVRIWSLPGNSVEAFEYSHKIASLAWSPTHHLVSASLDGSVRLSDRSGVVVKDLWNSKNLPCAVAWSHRLRSPQQQRLCVGQTAHRLTLLEVHQATVTSVAWSPDGTVLAFQDSEGDVIVWDTTLGSAQGASAGSFSLGNEDVVPSVAGVVVGQKTSSCSPVVNTRGPSEMVAHPGYCPAAERGTKMSSTKLWPGTISPPAVLKSTRRWFWQVLSVPSRM